jgi:hypothetical protein
MKALLTVFLALMLDGCAAKYGNFMSLIHSQHSQLAHDAAKLITIFQPITETAPLVPDRLPPTVMLKMTGDQKDTFYLTLKQDLADAGFKVVTEARDTLNLPKEVKYILDQTDASHVRLTIYLDDQVASRLYRSERGTLFPVGVWARQL